MNVVERYYRIRLSRSKKREGFGCVYIRAYCNGELIELGTTKTRFDPSLWCKKSNTIKNPNGDIDIDSQIMRLNQCKKLVNTIVDFYDKENKLLTAAKLKEEYEKAVNNKMKFETRHTVTAVDLYDRFISSNENLAHNTMRDYKYKRDKLKLYGEQKSLFIADIDRTFVANYKDWLKKYHNNTESSANKHIMRLRKVVENAVERGIVNYNPLSGIKTPQPYDTDLRCITIEQAWYLFNFQYSVKKFERAIDMYLFSVGTGICHADQVKLTSKNIDWQNRCITDKRQKTKTEYCAPITPLAEAILNKYGSVETIPKISNQKANDYIKLAMFEAGIQDAFEYKFHSGRKSFVNYCLNRDNPVEPYDLIKMIGHTSIDELRAYGEKSKINVINRFFEK